MKQKKVINIQPVTRIEGHARISIHLDHQGKVRLTRLNILSFRGFEKFVEGRAAEEIPRIVTRICGICPWMHHLAAVKAVEGCFGIEPARDGDRLRELLLLMAHVSDKILHFFFMAAPDFLLGSEAACSARNIFGMAARNPELARRVATMRQLAQQMIERFSGKAIHPVAAVPGGFSRPMTADDRKALLHEAVKLLDFALFALDFARKEVFPRVEDDIAGMDDIKTGFLGTVGETGGLRLYHGKLRLMKPDGSFVDFLPVEYENFIEERVEPWSYAKMPYARAWNEGFCLDSSSPRGIYRTNALARINVCDHIPTPRAQEALEEFRHKHGRPAQATLLYHWARLIELVYVSERTIELLEDPDILGTDVRCACRPGAGHGIACVEAPRGTLIHDYETDENGLITKANLIVGTTHNIAPMNLSVDRAARAVIRDFNPGPEALNRIEMAVRAYDP